MRYVTAVPVGFIAALLFGVVSQAFGYSDDVLWLGKRLVFTAIFASAFCFPARTRWFHAAALLGFGIVLFCLFKPIDYRSYEWYGLPNFRSIVTGGSLAVLAHGFIDLLVLAMTWPKKALEATADSAVGLPKTNRSAESRSGGGSFGR